MAYHKFAGDNRSVDLFSRYQNDDGQRLFSSAILDFDPSAEFHEYELRYYRQHSVHFRQRLDLPDPDT